MNRVGDLVMALRFALALPRHLRRPARAGRESIRARLARREDTFLSVLRRATFARPSSPYARLADHAGWTVADIEHEIRRRGIEATLGRLLADGVYLGADEMKGRRDVVRGSLRLWIGPDDLRNPLVVPALGASTSGSLGPATRVRVDLDTIRDRVPNLARALAARGGLGWRHAVWSVRGLIPLLWYSGLGRPGAAWFVMPGPSGPDTRFRILARFASAWSALLGTPLPPPVEAPLDDPDPILDWMDATRVGGATPHLWCSASAAVRLARSGRDLAGVRFTVTGEPVTAERLAAIRAAGADAAPDYGTADSGGFFTAACTRPAAPDDVHLFHDLVALVQPPGAHALHVTSLRPTTPFVLLNFALGDRATMARRSCGCPLERDGFPTHLTEIRGIEKLSAAGMSFDDGAIVTILERELPARFGGGPLDWQVAEVASADGTASVHLRAAPSIGNVDEPTVVAAFLEAIGRGSSTRRDMADQWRRAGAVRLVRERPTRGGTGKHHHVTREARPSDRA